MFNRIRPEALVSRDSIRALIPSPCVVCAENCNEVISLCRFCRQQLPWIKNACYACGLPLPETGLSANYCAGCLLEPPPFQFCRGLFHYRSPVNRLITQFKFQGRFDVGFSLARLLTDAFRAEYRDIAEPRLIVPVPLHRERLRDRGFNQALELGRILSRETGIPLDGRLVSKRRNTPPQTRQESAAKRRRSQAGAFHCGPRPGQVNHIAIIDDVVTTGATIRSLARTVRGRGIEHIDVWCLARAST